GKPVAGAWVKHTPMGDNKLLGTLPAGDGYRDVRAECKTDADGRYRFTGLAGSGLVLAQPETRGDARPRYTQVWLQETDKPRAFLSQADRLGEAFYAGDHIEPLFNYSAYKLIEPAKDAETFDVDLQFDPGKSVTGKVFGPDGKPLSGVQAHGLGAVWDRPTLLQDETFTAFALDPDHPRMLVFLHRERRLFAAITLAGNEKAPVEGKLQP